MDFYILALPRSGSHMLASALDSHPDICCAGEIWRSKPLYDWLGSAAGRICGAIATFGPGGFELPSTAKIICLTRNTPDRVKSYKNRDGLHWMEPTVLPAKEVVLDEATLAAREQYAKDLLLFAEKSQRIVLDYDEITGGKDIREIPEAIGRQLCDFLGVEYHAMTPRFYKPKRVA